MRNFKELKIWQEAMEIVYKVYMLSKLLPADERFGLTSQINRAVFSIPSNIAEGSSRESQKDYKRFLEIALGSAFELETHLLVSVKVRFLNEDAIYDIIQHLNKEQKMINSLISKIKANS